MKYALMGVGGIVFVIGVGLFGGNVSGMFVTFPFAGYIGMLVGGGIFGVGQRMGTS
jgi:hypothetical protein